MLAAAANSGVRAEDEYSSAEARSLDPSDPRATSTSPFRSIVAECPTRAVERLGPLDTVPAAGSTISLEFRIWLPSDPPTIMTRPSDNSTAAWFLRELVRVPASEKEPVAGLNISSVFPGAPEPSPPAIRTRPFGPAPCFLRAPTFHFEPVLQVSRNFPPRSPSSITQQHQWIPTLKPFSELLA